MPLSAPPPVGWTPGSRAQGLSLTPSEPICYGASVKCLPAVVWLFLTAAPALAQEPLPQGLSGPQKLAALVQRVSQVQSGMVTLEARFVQEKKSRLLVAPSASRGRLYFKAPDLLRWEYETPHLMTVLLAGGTVTTYRPAEKRADRVEVGRQQRRVFRLIGASEPLDKLKQYFSFTFLDPGAKGNYRLILQPTSRLVAKKIKLVELEIDRDRMMPIVVSYTEADGDVTTYSFTDIVTNKEIDPAMFTLELGPDVTISKLKLGSGE